jgi:GLPGLI family protein
MKLFQSRLIVLALLTFFSTITFAQDFQGKAYYQTKTTMDMSQFGGGNRQVSSEQMKRWQDRMKSFLEKEYVLTFNREESIYKEEERLEAQGGGGWGSTFSSSLTSGPRYKNVKDKEVIVDQEFFGKQFLIKDDLKPLEWKMGTETKTIGAYTVFKATATKEVDKMDWRSMRRRRPDDTKKEKDSSKTANSDDPMSEIETPKTIEIVAWYTPQIPVNQGPDEYWGLPGLILEINADRTTILCTKVVMNPKERDNIKKPEKGEVVTQEEYTEITTKKMEEMRSMWRGRRGRGRN